MIKRNINSQKIQEFALQKNNIKCKKGQQFIIEGAPVNGLFFVYQGKAKVLKTGYHGRNQILRFVKEGEIIGHRGFATSDTYNIGAIAIEDAILCNFSMESLHNVLKEVPELTYEMMLLYAKELNISETKVKALAQMSVRERVIDSLLYMHRKFGDLRGYINVSLSRKDYADYTGTSEEQIIRAFSSLKKENLIRTQGKKIGIVDVALLKKEIKNHNYFLDS